MSLNQKKHHLQLVIDNVKFCTVLTKWGEYTELYINI